MGSKKIGIRVAMFCAAAGTMLSACGGGSDNNPPPPPPPPPTYSLSGTVSGLSSTGLALTVNGSQVSVPSGATTIALTSSLASGAAYSVTVSTQPTGATCTVAAGTGAIASANVTDVAISCSANTYTVGGSITGLTLGGLVLVNGADSTSIAANATQFTMTNRVTHGGSYAITVGTYPLPRYCAVTRGSGTALNDVTDVAISCSANTYTVGGSITGLTLGGLVLVNGADSTSIAANATQFTMTNRVTHGGSYAITVGTYPLPRYCTVTRGSGTALNDVTDVAIICTTPVVYSFNGPPDASTPSGSLLQASDGNFYGTSLYGGATGTGAEFSGAGAVFRITPSGTRDCSPLLHRRSVGRSRACQGRPG